MKNEALDFFMDSARYCGFELPEYFEFNTLLKQVQKTIGDTTFGDCCCADPAEMDDVNLNILLNKDGKYGVRPLTLPNPFLYYFYYRRGAVDDMEAEAAICETAQHCDWFYKIYERLREGLNTRAVKPY